MNAIPAGVTLLDVRGLHAGYGRSDVLHGIDVRIEQGRIASIIGANGAGKTTTLLAISGLLPVRAGSIEFSGARIDGRTAHAIVSSGVTQVPEGRLILSQMSVRENLELGAWTRHGRAAVDDDIEAMFARFPILR
ncbi:MAG: ATP-binding cassette domain-containing protein, partial [Candidatus Eremiobacteraeota bacterium]|nr:ATP-binding cassette domain-containing protein [Candidatus Eremiobacteraeota bacterium]